MKTAIYTLSFFCLLFQLSCKSKQKKEPKEAVQKSTTENTITDNKPKDTSANKVYDFSLDKATNQVDWVAYKTTKKVPVKGKFNKVNILANGGGNSIKEAVNNAEFSIPVSSIFTEDTSRDFKIRKFFFQVMDNTKLLSGKLVLTDDSKGYADIKMNGVSHKLPFEYTISGNTFSLNAVMDLKLWKAEKALKSINTACKDLHRGTDGISKTWDEVAINIKSVFN